MDIYVELTDSKSSKYDIGVNKREWDASCLCRYGIWGDNGGSGYTAKKGPVRIQYKCLVSTYVFPEMKLFFLK